MRDVKGYEGFYSITKDGRIWSHWKNGWMTPRFNKQGYPIAVLNGRRKARYPRIHNLVAQAFIPNPEGKPEINHKNGIKTDNRVGNLEWCTRRENVLHSYRVGLRKAPVGEDCPLATLTEELVLQLRAEYKKKEFGYRKMAEKFGINQVTIRHVILRHCWKHI